MRNEPPSPDLNRLIKFYVSIPKRIYLKIEKLAEERRMSMAKLVRIWIIERAEKESEE